MSARPPPESFDTLEKAQAEIARLQGLLNRADSLLNAFTAFCNEVKDRAEQRAKMFGGQQ